MINKRWMRLRLRIARLLLGDWLGWPTLDGAREVEITIGRDANGGRVWINTDDGCMIRGYRIGRVRVVYAGVEIQQWTWSNGRSG